MEALQNITQRALFQLVGPEDYTPDYVSEPQRRDRCTLVRTVGHFLYLPNLSPTGNFSTVVSGKSALFVAGDKQVDDAFAADPAQFDITFSGVFPLFVRDYSPMYIFWSTYFRIDNQLTGGAGSAYQSTWTPPSHSPNTPWDINVKRRMQGDDALFLLCNMVFAADDPSLEVGGFIEVESRNLIMDQ